MIDKTYCARSVDGKCKHTECPRNLNGFYGMYVSLAEFDCDKELKGSENDK